MLLPSFSVVQNFSGGVARVIAIMLYVLYVLLYCIMYCYYVWLLLNATFNVQARKSLVPFTQFLCKKFAPPLYLVTVMHFKQLIIFSTRRRCRALGRPWLYRSAQYGALLPVYLRNMIMAHSVNPGCSLLCFPVHKAPAAEHKLQY